MSVQMLGAYKITPLSDGRYSVALTNGNMGACVMTKEALEAFKAKYNKQQDTVEVGGKKSNTAVKVIKGAASIPVSGLGQILDGRFKDGFKDMGKEVAILTAGGLIGKLGGLSFAKAVETGGKAYGFYGSLIAGLALTGLYMANKIHSVVDAYKKG